jgi:hypothetical protein
MAGVNQIQVNADVGLTFAQPAALYPASGPERRDGRRNP